MSNVNDSEEQPGHLVLDSDTISKLDPAGATGLLRLIPTAQTAYALLPALAGMQSVDLTLLRTLLDCLGEEPVAAVATRMQGAGVKDSKMGRWLLAELTLREGSDAAQAAWEEIVANGGYGQQAEALLRLSGLFCASGTSDLALQCLQQALADLGDTAPQGVIRRAERLYQKISTGMNLESQSLRIAVVGSSTTAFVIPALKMAAVRYGYHPVVYVSDYGQYQQEILDPSSGLYAFDPQFVIVYTHWRDAHFESWSETPDEDVERAAAHFEQLWRMLHSRCGCTILQHNFDLPWIDAAGYLGSVLPGSQRQRLQALNRELAERAPAGVVIVDCERVASAIGSVAWGRLRQWYMHKQHPAAECLLPLSYRYLALIRAIQGRSSKVLVLDLDNTLWSGVVGEDGVEGIRIGPPSAEGEAHADLQRYALDLKQRGILLAVCSKNNPADARLPFEQHDAMLLQLDDFVAFYANWEDKATNLHNMAQQLGLGLDSFVFLDDNPVERAQVREQLPQVVVPELGVDPASWTETLQRGMWFEALTLSAEDRMRHQQYQANAARSQLMESSPDLSAFLSQLQMEVTCGTVNQKVLDRVAQLIGKTNQFNLTCRRHSKEQVLRLIEDEQAWTQWFRLSDRYGDNGLVGVMIAVTDQSRPHCWLVDTFLLSCRVIGRGLEQCMLALLLKAARERGIKEIVGEYVATARNEQVADLYPRYGFSPLGEREGIKRYQLEVADAQLSVPEYLSVAEKTD